MFGYVLGNSAFLYTYDETQAFIGNSDGLIRGYSAIGTGGATMISLFRLAIIKAMPEVENVSVQIMPWEYGYTIPGAEDFTLIT